MLRQNLIAVQALFVMPFRVLPFWFKGVISFAAPAPSCAALRWYAESLATVGYVAFLPRVAAGCRGQRSPIFLR